MDRLSSNKKELSGAEAPPALVSPSPGHHDPFPDASLSAPLNRETMGEVASALADPSSYNSTIGWRFEYDRGAGDSSTIRQYAAFVREIMVQGGTAEPGLLDEMLVTSRHDDIARTVASRPNTFDGLSNKQLERLEEHLRLPMRRTENDGQGLGQSFTDVTVPLAEASGFGTKIEVIGGFMAARLYVPEDGGKAELDFVPTFSLGAVHAFDERLSRDLTDDQKLQAKLDMTNTLIAVAQSSELQTGASQLLGLSYSVDDERARGYESIPRVDVLATNITNERFASYLGNKFGFDVSPLGGDSYKASIRTADLVEILPELIEIRSDYLDRMRARAGG